VFLVNVIVVIPSLVPDLPGLVKHGYPAAKAITCSKGGEMTGFAVVLEGQIAVFGPRACYKPG
jgi:hypothetical protein